MEGLFFMLGAVDLTLALKASPKVRTGILLALATAAALYTQPYAALGIFGAGLWLLAPFTRPAAPRNVFMPLVCMSFSVLLFLPWYMHAAKQWKDDIRVGGFHFKWSFGMIQDVIKGLSGGSILCSALLLVLVGFGCLSKPAGGRGILLSLSASVVLGALALDYFQGYFFATRQILFVVPALAILAGMGLFTVMQKSQAAAIVIAGGFLVAASINDFTIQTRSKENWPAASRLLLHVSAQNYCIRIAGADQNPLNLYGLFAPGLKAKLCGPLEAERRVALVSGVAVAPEISKASEDEFHDMGFTVAQRLEAGGTAVELEER